MRSKILIGFTVLLLAGMNLSVLRNESLSENGETVLLELAPVDPRALLMGDYMDLQYRIDRDILTLCAACTNREQTGACPEKGTAVVLLDDRKTAVQVLRLEDGTPLKEGEARLAFRARDRQVRIAPEAFFFQEGHAQAYEQARYGEFRVDEEGNKLLVHMVDKHFNRIIPEATPREKDQ